MALLECLPLIPIQNYSRSPTRQLFDVFPIVQCSYTASRKEENKNFKALGVSAHVDNDCTSSSVCLLKGTQNEANHLLRTVPGREAMQLG